MDDTELYDGYCEFCGQVVQFNEVTLRHAGMDKMLAAKIVCDCKEAEKFRTRSKNVVNGMEQVDMVAGDESERPVSREVLSYLRRTVEGIIDKDFKKVTVQINATEKVVVKATKKGIKVSRETKKTKESEAEMIL